MNWKWERIGRNNDQKIIAAPEEKLIMCTKAVLCTKMENEPTKQQQCTANKAKTEQTEHSEY